LAVGLALAARFGNKPVTWIAGHGEQSETVEGPHDSRHPPEAIKMAPVIKELEKCPTRSLPSCATAQHREMLDHVDVFDIGRIKLDLMRPAKPYR
jgi:hypothetical protein